ncbi:MAG TPA: Rieske 2Fe-2S domain-containing protein [Candidatus Nanopelagicaceae bacterium]
MSTMQSHVRATVASWRTQSPAVRVIRLWLGFTWIFGGWDKATDPGFLSKTGTTYIGRQLTGYAHSSPLGFFFRHLIERATFVGIVVMVAEFAIGLATLLWIAPTTMAFAGFTMSLGLWVAATWHVKPYFLGSDTAYAVLWLSYLLTLIGKRRKVDVSLDRRGAIRVGVLGAAAIVAAIFGRIFSRPSATRLVGLAPAGSTSGGASTANRIIKLSNFPVGQTHEFSTSDGQPAIVFRTKNGVFAYSEICTHQGCTVSYSAPDKVLFCPCHGGAYDPFNHAQVVGGPPPTPLPPVKVAISGDWVVVA